QFAKDFQVFGLAIFAEPLQFMFVALRAKPSKLCDARVEPSERIRKRQGVKGLEIVVFADRDQSGGGIGSMIERKDERAREIGGVKCAGGMAKVVIETEKAPAGKKQAQAGEHRFTSGALFLPVSVFCSPIGKRNRAYIRKAQARRGKNLLQS